MLVMACEDYARGRIKKVFPASLIFFSFEKMFLAIKSLQNLNLKTNIKITVYSVPVV